MTETKSEEEVTFRRDLKPNEQVRVEYNHDRKRLVLLVVRRYIPQMGTDGSRLMEG